MITVTRISKGKGPFYQVDLSVGEPLRVSEDVLIRYRLLKGRELDEELIKEIKKSSGEDFGFQQALNYLSYQLRSEKEIRTYLKEKEIVQEDRNKIVARLKELDLINDLVYGESYVRTQMRLSDKGPRKLSQQLQQKGLKPEIIEQALSQYLFEDQVEVASIAAQKAYKKNHGKSQKELLRKIQQNLMTKGFNSEVIQQAIAQLPQEVDEEAEYELLVSQGEKLWRKNARFDLTKRRMKVKQSLYQKGFNLELIQRFISEKEAEISE
ncbi:recombination regulator RecX [Enterococcus thailandicus]|uniref:Regulatory protein RecX n=1 Tax=Enterococcus thailandicus TaxID=417368 RepID=A0A510WB03_ENTTH|nr:recombination regulator RecX [Enterococcus thailandicus]GEK36392.1 regulatory protein RecX [Enterococcus thailandicus]